MKKYKVIMKNLKINMNSKSRHVTSLIIIGKVLA